MAIKGLYDIFAERWYVGGQIYIYSDPHFGDLDCYRRRFGKNVTMVDVAKYDQMQIDNINKTAFKNDTLIMLGDIGDVSCVAKLRPNNKVLIMGNHDHGATTYKRKITIVNNKTGETLMDITESIYVNPLLRDAVVNDWKRKTGSNDIRVIDNRLFNEVYEDDLIVSSKIKLSHAPMPEAGKINLHGHDHAYNDGYCFAAEHIGYKPVSLKSILESGVIGKTTSARRSVTDKAIKRASARKAKSESSRGQ